MPRKYILASIAFSFWELFLPVTTLEMLEKSGEIGMPKLFKLKELNYYDETFTKNRI